jgi:preprotein translocase subunit YajC
MNQLANLNLDFLLDGSILAQATAAEGSAPTWVNFLPFVILLVMFYFLLIRPQQKKMKAHQALVSAVKSGDKVVAAGGVHGTVTNVKDATIILKVSEQVKIEVEKASISLVNPEQK